MPTIDNKNMRLKSGQVLILVLLTVIVVLTIGLSVASRNITNLRTTTQTEQSQRAFTAAEGGIEDILANIDEISSLSNVTSEEGYTNKVTVGDLEATVNVKASSIYDGAVSLGDVLQVNLVYADGSIIATPNVIQIEWAKNINLGEIDFAEDGPASIEVTQIYGSNQQERFYFEGITARSGENGAVAGTCTAASGEFARCAQVALQPNAKILRIKPFWANTTVQVAGAGFDLPVQWYDLTSTAQSEIGVTRSVNVRRSALPRLPAIFDYVLFSETDLEK